MSVAAIVLAAGQGTRMKSELLKVLHPVAGLPMIQYVINAVKSAQVRDLYLIVGHQKSSLMSYCEGQDVHFVSQDQQLGTGHAVMQAVPHLRQNPPSQVIVLAGDCPLIQPQSIQAALADHHEHQSSVTVLTTCLDDPAQYGRIVRDEQGALLRIQEFKDCSDTERQINEINSGIFVFNTSDLLTHLDQLTTNNQQQEYYLTDMVALVKAAGKTVTAYCHAHSDEVMGINSRAELAQASQVVYQQINQRHMAAGVSIQDPQSTFIDASVEIGSDTVIEPFTILKGATQIASHCHIGAHSYLSDVSVQEGEVLPAYSRRDQVPS